MSFNERVKELNNARFPTLQEWNSLIGDASGDEQIGVAINGYNEMRRSIESLKS